MIVKLIFTFLRDFVVISTGMRRRLQRVRRILPHAAPHCLDKTTRRITFGLERVAQANAVGGTDPYYGDSQGNLSDKSVDRLQHIVTLHCEFPAAMRGRRRRYRAEALE
ncbi:MAG: hypothetical protein ACRYHA_27480 [Janthinobacterium lividum]